MDCEDVRRRRGRKDHLKMFKSVLKGRYEYAGSVE